MSQLWTIGRVAELVASALAGSDYSGQGSARVRAIPDRRTIRYYTTLGLVDRPAEMRGRTAFYGRRHVLQLVAIKRLQATGLPLVDVQQRLAGADDSALARLANLPQDFTWQVPQRGGSGLETSAVAAPPPMGPNAESQIAEFQITESQGADSLVAGTEPSIPESPALRSTRFWEAVPAASQAETESSPLADVAGGAEAAGEPRDKSFLPFQAGRVLSIQLAANVRLEIKESRDFEVPAEDSKSQATRVQAQAAGGANPGWDAKVIERLAPALAQLCRALEQEGLLRELPEP